MQSFRPAQFIRALWPQTRVQATGSVVAVILAAYGLAGSTVHQTVGWILLASIVLSACYHAWRVEFERNKSLSEEDMLAIAAKHIRDGGNPIAALILAGAHKLRSSAEVARLCDGLVAAKLRHPFGGTLYVKSLEFKEDRKDYLGFLKRIYREGRDLDKRPHRDSFHQEVEKRYFAEATKKIVEELDANWEASEAKLLKERQAEGLAE